jgi:hypothetical protein
LRKAEAALFGSSVDVIVEEGDTRYVMHAAGPRIYDRPDLKAEISLRKEGSLFCCSGTGSIAKSCDMRLSAKDYQMIMRKSIQDSCILRAPIAQR